jgi:hypothetical protein
VTVVRSRTGFDCGVTALAVLVTDITMRRVDPKMRGLKTLYSRELIAAAKVAGITLRSTRRFDLDRDQGILRVYWNNAAKRKDSPYGHYVTVLGGSIHCTSEHVVMPWRDYVIKYDARPCTLLREVA